MYLLSRVFGEGGWRCCRHALCSSYSFLAVLGGWGIVCFGSAFIALSCFVWQLLLAVDHSFAQMAPRQWAAHILVVLVDNNVKARSMTTIEC